MQYEDVADLLPGLVDGSAEVEDRALAFIESDLRCQAELVRYRRMLRGLRALRSSLVEPAPGALAGTLAALEELQERSLLRSVAGRRRLAGAIGTAVVTAGAATAAVLIARSRRSQPGVAA